MGFPSGKTTAFMHSYECKLRKEFCTGFSMISIDFSEPEIAFDRNILKKCKSCEPCKS